MKKSIATISLFAITVACVAPAVFAEDKKPSNDTEFIFVPKRSCSELPTDIQARSLGCEEVKVWKRSYAKVKVGYAPFERQALESEELAYRHGG